MRKFEVGDKVRDKRDGKEYTYRKSMFPGPALDGSGECEWCVLEFAHEIVADPFNEYEWQPIDIAISPTAMQNEDGDFVNLTLIKKEDLELINED